MASVVAWLIKQSINTQPWAEVGVLEEEDAKSRVYLPAKKIVLGGFLAVVTSLFMLLISAYRIRMEYPDWSPFHGPDNILWINTGLLILASIFYQKAKSSATRNDDKGTRIGLLLAGAFTFSFLYGQFIAWKDMIDQGMFIYTSPANAFFYVITFLHAAHILGGLWVWGRSTIKVLAGPEEEDNIKLSVDLCAIYWHFLLIIWLIMFYLLLST